VSEGEMESEGTKRVGRKSGCVNFFLNFIPEGLKSETYFIILSPILPNSDGKD
jgi:hypothetical protein